MINYTYKPDKFYYLFGLYYIIYMNITGGKFKGRQISAPDEKITRPTLSKVRMGVFNSLYSMLGNFDGLSFLDVFGGSGIMGLEALSRGFSNVTVIEQNKKSALILRKNYELLKLNSDLIIGNALNIIPKLNQKYTVAYVDPPYSSGIYETIYEQLQSIAQVIVLEHPAILNLNYENIIKQKKYGDKIITYIKET